MSHILILHLIYQKLFIVYNTVQLGLQTRYFDLNWFTEACI